MRCMCWKTHEKARAVHCWMALSAPSNGRARPIPLPSERYLPSSRPSSMPEHCFELSTSALYNRRRMPTARLLALSDTYARLIPDASIYMMYLLPGIADTVPKGRYFDHSSIFDRGQWSVLPCCFETPLHLSSTAVTGRQLAHSRTNARCRGMNKL